MHWLYIAPLLVIMTLGLAGVAVGFVFWICGEFDKFTRRGSSPEYDAWEV